MQKKIILLLISLFFINCGSGLKSRWGNFTAYYNTYYNAKRSYNTGLDKVLNANVVYNPQQPIRIYEVPINAGAQDFDKAIEKGAEILRKHGDSKWVDNSLNLIGKSYFFKREYFSADQKFQELVMTTDDESLIQESIVWRSRVLYEMELYGQGIQYIIQEINNREDSWKPKNKAELNSILAEYYVYQENWELAINNLNDALPNLKSKKYKERGFFLLGQLYERIGNYEEALKAYNRVDDFYYDYDLQYLAFRKSAETARFLGDNKSALDTFKSMSKDDKNSEFKPELDYEIARTYQEQKNYKEAERIYKSILRNIVNRPTVEIKALVYNGLAEIYRFGYNDFEMAAAYYDTSSSQNASIQKLPVSYNAKELAVSFGEYSFIKNELNYRDSLLWVSNLPKTKLDSLIAEIKKRKIKEVEEERRNQEERQNTLVNVSGIQQEGNNESGSGFLNENSSASQNNARAQFIAIWGDRPLVDNWRVRELVRSTGPSQGQDGIDTLTSQRRTITSIETSVDLSEVPFNPEQKIEARREIASLKYQLGNLFFISLNMPDSAAIYFKDVIENHPESNEAAVSYYSLSEIQSSVGLEEEALENAKILIQRFPSSRYSIRLAEKYGLELNTPDSTQAISLNEQYELLMRDTSLTKSELASKSTQLALDNSEDVQSAKILFEATQKHIELGKQDSIYKENYVKWVDARTAWKSRQAIFRKTQDSARIEIKNSSITKPKKDSLQSIIDSSLVASSFSDLFPYKGQNWDNARTNIDLFLSNFGNSELASRISMLKLELEKPLEENPKPEQENDSQTTISNSSISCNEFENRPQVRGGLDNFIKSIDSTSSEVEELVYRMSINQRGIIESFELVTQIQDNNLVEAYKKAIENNLTFSPVLVNGEAVKVECEFTFPIN